MTQSQTPAESPVQNPAEGAPASRRVALVGALEEAQRARLLDICERTPVNLALRAGVAIETTEEKA
ncbi:hypothetical protein [Kitasatospora sp. NBC_00315]|uniref:hypothetical protein n=1 Tax=Kitasatospora sp. NBC_00315 TaxID=2975963 RepID=UPI003251AFD1